MIDVCRTVRACVCVCVCRTVLCTVAILILHCTCSTWVRPIFVPRHWSEKQPRGCRPDIENRKGLVWTTASCENSTAQRPTRKEEKTPIGHPHREDFVNNQKGDLGLGLKKPLLLPLKNRSSRGRRGMKIVGSRGELEGELREVKSSNGQFAARAIP